MAINEEVTKAYDTVVGALQCRDFLEQMAEEAAELAQAALKVIRALGLSENFTPVSDEEAWAALREEFNDVLLIASVIGISVDEEQYNAKLMRWADRLAGGEK